MGGRRLASGAGTIFGPRRPARRSRGKTIDLPRRWWCWLWADRIMGASVSAEHRREEALMLAVCENDIEALAALLAEGIDVDCFDDEQSRPLHIAAALGHERICSALLAAGADIEAKGQLDGTPLHAAASACRPGTVSLLLSAGACVDARDESGLTPLHRSAQRPHATAVARLLLAAGAAVDACNVDQYTPLHVSCMRGHTDMARLFLAAGARADGLTAQGDSALQLLRRAGAEGDRELCSQLERASGGATPAVEPASPPASPPT